jgi:hypothetical protein
MMRRAIVTLAAWAIAVPAFAQAAPDLSGFWELSFDSRRVPEARLTPGLPRAALAEQARRDAHAVRWCNTLGVPFMMGVPRPLDIRQGRRIIVIAAESAVTAPRYLYLDRTNRPSREEFEPTTNGFSLARWERETLVVETTGFSPTKGMTAIPGGGFRTADSTLTERFRLLQNGAVLAVTSTWEDPKVFRAPHTYEYRYHRVPRGYEARPPVACDPFDDERTAFVTAPGGAAR